MVSILGSSEDDVAINIETVLGQHLVRAYNLPRTNNDLEQTFGVLRHSGRKVAPSSLTCVLAQLEEQGMIQRLPMHMTLVQAQELWHYEI
ncbi:hypothetical protein [Brunnivagina elsteri]|uniref:Uncharacterized protein n=1 Tax=Brunnivagina elsteri CCALA 953 TaxID=987040 RepID=A0A2A2TCQ8_9CYAN|nr:hypothetical protein [Calothrix elsteri]PAX51544.1 hypothetical protein CK510_24220 [Calothrix elsteri CCALA 953]